MKMRLPFSSGQKALITVSFLLAAGYFAYLAIVWKKFQGWTFVLWNLPFSSHFEMAGQWMLLAPAVLIVFLSLLIWRFSTIQVVHTPPSLQDSIRIELFGYIRTALGGVNALAAAIFWVLTYYAANQEEIRFAFSVFVILLLGTWVVLCTVQIGLFLRRLRDGLNNTVDSYEI